MISTNDIRQSFLDFFVRQGHEAVASSPLVPRNDPSLMFANSGMVQFKNVFTGAEQRFYSRATTAQKCVRAGGKHNDLENVGYTARHHTFFEMMGNFSFGDYFKETAIEHAWTLITKEWQLPREKLLVTVYADDDEAAGLWRKIAGLSDDRIIRIATSDNFWSMGDTGPCGPCSEIFFDHGDHIQGGPPGSPNEDGDRFIEIWNLVFMQYEQLAPGQRVGLPKPSIDTGMGLERLTAVMQGKHDNYDIDLIRSLIEASADASNTAPDGPHAVSHRVIADHLRSSCFLIADGVLPSNEGRGYVLRRIMRRAMRHAHILGCQEPMIYRLIPALMRQMGGHYPELLRAQALMVETLKLEESRFKQTLDRGLKLLADEVGKLGDKVPLAGDVAFKLYDTFGFPLDLTQDVLRGQGRGVDIDGFQTAMARQKAEARKAWVGSGDTGTDKLWFDIRDTHGATEFLGYDSETAEAEVRAIIHDGAIVAKLDVGQSGLLVVNQTPFYGESGGQVGDTGAIFTADGVEATVTDTQKRLGDIFVHSITITRGSLKTGQAIELRVDGQRRNRIKAHHSATHLLHEALRRHLGDHVAQKGSMVTPDRLRFDISHPKAIDETELAAAEIEVNNHIRENSVVITRLLAVDDAIKSGARALFGEKYGDEVRVVSMGAIQPDTKNAYSVELCGGIHVGQTGEIGLLKIIGESAVSSGVRRIEALTGKAALDYLAQQEARLYQAASLLKSTPADVVNRISNLLDDRKKLEREIADLRRKTASGGNGDGPTAKEVGGIPFIGMVVDLPPGDLKSFADQLALRSGDGVVVLVTTFEEKASVVVRVGPNWVGRISAVDLVRAATPVLGGKGGGGRPDMAQGGGPDTAQAVAAIEAVELALAG
jgi:alanyl-tRNA synthetase